MCSYYNGKNPYKTKYGNNGFKIIFNQNVHELVLKILLTLTMYARKNRFDM